MWPSVYMLEDAAGSSACRCSDSPRAGPERSQLGARCVEPGGREARVGRGSLRAAGSELAARRLRGPKVILPGIASPVVGGGGPGRRERLENRDPVQAAPRGSRHPRRDRRPEGPARRRGGTRLTPARLPARARAGLQGGRVLAQLRARPAMSSLYTRSKEFPRSRKSTSDSPPATPSPTAKTLRVSGSPPCLCRVQGVRVRRGGGPSTGVSGRERQTLRGPPAPCSCPSGCLWL